MATETAAVLEWNVENVLIWVDRPTQLQNTWFLKPQPRECSMPGKRFLAIFSSLFFDIIIVTTPAAQSDSNISSSAISKFAPKCTHFAQDKLNEYSASHNNLSTSPTCSTFVEQQMLNHVSST